MKGDDFISPAGRPKSNNPQSERFEIRLTKGEMEDLEYCSNELRSSKTEVVKRGIAMVKETLNQKK